LDKSSNWSGWSYGACAGLSVVALPCAVLVVILPRVGVEVDGVYRGLAVILLSAAIGFGTNWLAIKMLFHPRTPMRWLVFWPQGALPREQARLARELGRLAEERLLTREALRDLIGSKGNEEQFRKELRARCGSVLRQPEFRQGMGALVRELWVNHGRELIALIRPDVQRVLAQNTEKLITAERLEQILVTSVERFVESRPLRKTLARIMTRQTAEEDGLERIMGLLQGGFDRYREEHPVKGFLAEQFMLDWDQLRRQIRRTLQSDEATEELAGLFLQAASRLLRRLEEAESRESLQKIRSSIVESVLGWLEFQGIPQVEEALANWAAPGLSWEGFKDLEEKIVQELPHLWEKQLGEWETLILREIQNAQEEWVNALPVAQLVENQILRMNPRELQDVIEDVSRTELALIQVLGFVLGAVAGVGMLLLLRV
jgi:uncharacterized membrane protein YheB (UPF0754 family)